MLRRIALAASLAIVALGARAADEEPEWNSIIVRFDVDRDGKLHITEQVQVDVPPNVQRLQRTYPQATFDAITLYADHTIPLEESGDLDRAHRFRETSPGTVTWSVRDLATQPDDWRSLTYVIESRVDDAVIPAWSIPRGNWRELLDHPRHRFLVDYLYEMPPPSTKGTEIQLQIYWPPGWKPVHEITPDTVARELRRDASHPDRWQLRHFFDEDGRRELINDDFTRHAIRMAALIGFPIIAFVFFIAFLLRELLLRRTPADGEQLARDVVYNETPEVIEARWSGRVPQVPAEEFIERVQRKSAPTPFEQTLMFLLKEKGAELDPGEMLHELLRIETNAARRRTPWLLRAVSFAIFITGVYFAIQEIVRNDRKPVVLAAGVIACAALFVLWPSKAMRAALLNAVWPSLFLLLPLALMFALTIAIQFIEAPGIYASGGLAAMLLGTYLALLASSASRGSQLARARRWLQRELRSPAPRIRHDAKPWLAALGLKSS